MNTLIPRGKGFTERGISRHEGFNLEECKVLLYRSCSEDPRCAEEGLQTKSADVQNVHSFEGKLEPGAHSHPVGP